MAEWCDLTESEKGCIESLLDETDWADYWEIEKVIGRVLDDFGSLALTMRGAPVDPDLKTTPITSAFFSDND
jgi:hypothetical protein